MKVFINGISSISAQKSVQDNGIFSDTISYSENILPTVNPVYKDYISPGAARRMAKGVKMGTVVSKIALQEAKISNPDAIITGTGMGCTQDSEKFVRAIIDNNEQFLTPTSFIQSTHNTVGAQIALGLQCNNYNFTYVNDAVSFESCLIDAQMMLSEGAENVLVGGVDEHGQHTNELHKIIGHIKSETIKNLNLFDTKTTGTIFGEGANFFVLSRNKSADSYATLIDTDIYNRLERSGLEMAVQQFMRKNGLTPDDIDIVILGNNGDVEFDQNYQPLTNELFKNTQQVVYKHLCGEYNTASAYGFYLAVNILKRQEIPKVCRFNTIDSNKYQNVLLYNQYRGKNHSLVLLQHANF
ncbi:MAG: 3-oxoacyl-ACP synthase [Flavobacteriales bacterium]|nr:MAG: 3-oxoacyl-ACP synthase [Flavobacteriales bacterium]PIE48993.1 MAG: 3-oxoacyl-ACP synthase [Flavobacteriales bacterium]